MKTLKSLTIILAFIIVNTNFCQNKFELDEGLKKISNDIINYLSSSQVKILFFENFKNDKGQTNKLSLYIKEELKNNFQETQMFKIIEENVDQTSNDAFSANSAKNADAKIEGSFIDLGESVKITSKAISIRTGKLLATASVEILKDNRVANLLEQKQPLPDKKPSETPIGHAVGQEQKSSTPETAKGSFFPKTFKRGDIEVSLISAKRQGFEITFDFIVKNIVKDETIYFATGVTRLIDQEGKSHQPDVNFPYSIDLVENINHKIQIKFKSSAFSKLNTIPLLEFQIWNQSKIQIRDIPLQTSE